MKTLLLLAGRSRRFWPLMEKTLFPICGKTLLEEQVARLKKGGATDITLVGGAHNLANAKKLFPTLRTIEQEDLALGMRGAMLSALPSLQDEPVMIVGGNDVIDPAGYRDLLKAAKQKGVDGAILARTVGHYFPGGYLSVKNGRITGIVEKPGAGNEPSDLVNIVAHIHNDASILLAALQRIGSDHDDGYERALDALFPSATYKAVPYAGAWQPVKYAWHLLPLLSLLLKDITKKSIHKTAKIHKTAVIDGNVIIAEGVKVLAHATVVGPCYIGPGTIIGNGALVRGSSVGAGCVIGFGTEVKGSVLAGRVWTHMTYLGDSIIGENVSFGGGTITGNLRLDESGITSHWEGDELQTHLTKFGAVFGNDCRVGIHVGINPGVKVGAKSFIAGGTFVKQDIPDGSFARMKNGEMVISPNRAEAPEVHKRSVFLAKTKPKRGRK